MRFGCAKCFNEEAVIIDSFQIYRTREHIMLIQEVVLTLQICLVLSIQMQRAVILVHVFIHQVTVHIVTYILHQYILALFGILLIVVHSTLQNLQEPYNDIAMLLGKIRADNQNLVIASLGLVHSSQNPASPFATN